MVILIQVSLLSLLIIILLEVILSLQIFPNNIWKQEIPVEEERISNQEIIYNNSITKIHKLIRKTTTPMWAFLMMSKIILFRMIVHSMNNFLTIINWPTKAIITNTYTKIVLPITWQIHQWSLNNLSIKDRILMIKSITVIDRDHRKVTEV